MSNYRQRVLGIDSNPLNIKELVNFTFVVIQEEINKTDPGLKNMSSSIGMIIPNHGKIIQSCSSHHQDQLFHQSSTSCRIMAMNLANPTLIALPQPKRSHQHRQHSTKLQFPSPHFTQPQGLPSGYVRPSAYKWVWQFTSWIKVVCGPDPDHDSRVRSQSHDSSIFCTGSWPNYLFHFIFHNSLYR